MSTTMVAKPETLADCDEHAVSWACAQIAPNWPLDRSIAVNPFWEMIDRSLPELGVTLGALTGARLSMPRALLRRLWNNGEFRREDIEQALAEADASASADDLLTRLNDPHETPIAARLRVMDLLDHGSAPSTWREFVTTQTSQFCAAFCDDQQAIAGPDRDGGLYASWRRHTIADRGAQLSMEAPDLRSFAAALPSKTNDGIVAALGALEIPLEQRPSYLLALLLDLNGWAAWCAYRRWEARLAGRDDDGGLRDLLAIRLSWEVLLLRLGGHALAARWQRAEQRWPAQRDRQRADQEFDWVLQRAAEIGYRERLSSQLTAAPAPTEPAQLQAVFCIDVRAEPYRRALEATGPGVHTLGFAGFFGLSIAYAPAGTTLARPQLPGLLAPRLIATEAGIDAHARARRRERLHSGTTWKQIEKGAASTFPFVDALGPLYLLPLLAETLRIAARARRTNAGTDASARHAKLELLDEDAQPLELATRCTLAEGILRAMSLTGDFARTVLLVGHGAETRNNPMAAGLDCGACCGQSGDVNARLGAALLNDPEVRAGLVERGIVIPASTEFFGALHDTTSDDVQLFDIDETSPARMQRAAEVRELLTRASQQARIARSAALGLRADNSSVHAAVRRRGRDWAEVRPEWGLTDNAAFVVAPRSRTRALDLGGRAFLHEYRADQDTRFAVLEAILTAPMVVCHWINMQYYASTVDNAHYGSGNKVLHNVVGGHLGVFEGNGGDLRIGLPMQSLHDGEHWRHTPLRLAVFVEAPRAPLEEILRKHETVRTLVENGWVELVQIEPGTSSLAHYTKSGWVPREERAWSAPAVHAARPDTPFGCPDVGTRSLRQVP